MALTIQNAKDINAENTRLRVLVYGQAGTGKTTLGSTFPRPCFISTDDGLLSIRGRDVKYIEIPKSTSWFVDVRDAVSKAGDHPEVDSIIIDSMTGVAEAAMEFVKAINKNTGKKTSYDDWEGFANTIRDFITNVAAYKKHTLFIMHEATDKDENTGRLWGFPAIQGQMKNKISNYFDEVYRAEVEQQVGGKPPKYQLLARPTSIYTAKSRLLTQANQIYIEPSFDALFSLVTSKK